MTPADRSFTLKWRGVLGIDLDFTGNLSPGDHFFSKPRLGFLQGSRRDDIEALLLQYLLDRGCLKCLCSLASHLLEHVFGGACRCEESLPSNRTDAWETRLTHRWDAWKRRQPCMIGKCQRPQCSGLDVACGAGSVQECDLDCAREQIVDHPGSARLVGYCSHLQIAGALCKQCHVVVRVISNTGRAEVEFSRVFLCVIN